MNSKLKLECSLHFTRVKQNVKSKAVLGCASEYFKSETAVVADERVPPGMVGSGTAGPGGG